MGKLYPDISHYHPVNDWKAVTQATGFIISKATQGTSYVDSTLDKFISGCEKNHIPYWLYTYLNKGGELAQTKFLVAVCKNKVGEYFQGYVLDIEAGNAESNCITALEWLKKQGHKTMIYTGWADRTKYKKLIADRGDTQWWEARYGKNTGSYNESYPCHAGVDLHQYTSRGKCPGVEGLADLNRIVDAKEKDFMNAPEDPAPTDGKKTYTGDLPVFASGRDCYKLGDGISTLRNYPTQIKRVQWLLNWINTGYRGYGKKRKGSIVVDGKYGAKTKEACIKAQELIGANADGVFGPQTLRMAKVYQR